MSRKPLSVIILNTVMVLIFSITNSIAIQASKQNPIALLAIVKQDSINIVDLLDNKEIIIDSNGNFKNPLINNTGELVVYLNNKDLYIASTTKNYTQPIKITENCENVSYDWLNNNILVYSSKQGGMKIFNFNNESSDICIESEEVYSDLKCDNNGNIYANKFFYYGDNAIENLGIIKYNPYTKEEKTIINAIETDIENDNNGLSPKILDISNDSKYIYIALTYNSASLNADGVPFGVYDIQKNELKRFNDVLFLCNSDAIAINPMNSSKIVLNIGALRELHINKTIGYVDTVKENVEFLLPQNEISINDTYSYNIEAKGLVTMTPSFSRDGKTLYYAASPANGQGYEQWLNISHPIYSMDLSSNNIKRITFPENQFDFAPHYIETNDEIIFLRTKELEGICSLWKIKNSQESMISDNIIQESFDTKSIMDLFIKII